MPLLEMLVTRNSPESSRIVSRPLATICEGTISASFFLLAAIAVLQYFNHRHKDVVLDRGVTLQVFAEKE